MEMPGNMPEQENLLTYCNKVIKNFFLEWHVNCDSESSGWETGFQSVLMTNQSSGPVSEEKMTITKKLMGVAAGILVSGTLMTLPAAAQEKKLNPGTFSGNVALTNEYYFRGISQTDDAPAIQGGFDYNVDLDENFSLYAGVWGSNVDFNEAPPVDGATIEIDFYGGITTSIADTGISLDVGFIYYTYPGADSSLNYDFWEIQTALGYDFGLASVTGSINYSPENFGKSGSAVYYKLGVDVPVLKDKATLSAYVARQTIQDNAAFGVPDYTEWNVSVGTSIAGFDVSLAYSDTDVSPEGDGNGPAGLLTISRSF